MVRRITAGLLTLLLTVSLIPATVMEAKAATWMDPYLNTALEWGVITPDANGNVDGYKKLTRADFVAMVNRAFGYTEVGPNHFIDVPANAWYAEDICIAYKAGYFAGTSSNTASPNDLVTREQAAVLLARNLRLEGTPGEVLDFTDSREMGNWSRGLVQQAARLGIIKGYGDGRFGPKEPVTMGQMATFLTRALGTRIAEPGEYSNVGAYTHLTITSPDVTLKNATITGNLYLAGGVRLEDVVLENVNVQGRIVVAGGGTAQAGENSVILRNVTAQELVVDSLTNQTLSVRAEGLTNIGLTDVRTSSYLEDVTRDGLGLRKIEFDSIAGATLQLAGNIKDVLNLTSASKLDIAQGVAGVVTVDEKAIGTTVNVATGSYVKDLNLDAGATVDGLGDIDHLDVMAPGSTVTMLPDTITVRPGTTANIYGEEMDTAAAAESSEDPRILSGYPKAQEVAPKTAQIAFSTNKKGTLYWALTAMADGSVGEEQLIKPSGYSSKIIKSGTIAVGASNTEVLAKLSGLTSGGSYYVSAMLEDNRGTRSPVKVMAFATPDDTTPAFASGYPKAILSEDASGKIVLQAHVMANKDCRLYYALLPSGSTAPKASDFKAAAVTGNLGYGSEDLRKNTPFLVSQVNNSTLKEQTKYDLYLWLTDIDGNKSSAVKKLQVETPDKTAPKIQRLSVTSVESKSVELTFAMDEPGTFYWAVVKQGTTFYSEDIQGGSAGKLIDSDDAKRQIETGLGALKKGSKAAAKAATDYAFKVSGLEPQTAYDLYFVAKDKSGNYSMYVEPLDKPLTIKTDDTVVPTVEQKFSKNSGTDSKPVPYPDSRIDLVFSEIVEGFPENNLSGTVQKFRELYMTSVASGLQKDKDALADALAKHIKLYRYNTAGGVADPATVRTSANQNDSNLNWDIDYRNATVSLNSESGELTISFPYYDEGERGNEGKSATKLAGGATYYFVLSYISDTSDNILSGSTQGEGLKLTEFTVVSAQIHLSKGVKASTAGQDFHMTFTATPISNDSMADNIYSDLIFWCDMAVAFELYQANTAGDWELIGEATISYQDEGTSLGTSKSFIATGGRTDDTALSGKVDLLRDLKERQYAIKVTDIPGKSWNVPIRIDVTAVSGVDTDLFQLTRNLTQSQDYEDVVTGGIMDISDPYNFYVNYTFVDNTPPEFTSLSFDPGDTGVNIGLMLNRNGARYYYVVAPLGQVDTVIKEKGAMATASLTEANYANLPTRWAKVAAGEENVYYATTPNHETVKIFKSNNSFIRAGSGTFSTSLESIRLADLKPQTKYVAYFVLQGESQASNSEVYCFQFQTQPVSRPIIQTTVTLPTVQVSTDKTSVLNYILVRSDNVGMPFNQDFMTSGYAEGLTGADLAKYKSAAGLTATDTFTVLHAMGTSVYKPNAAGQNQVAGTVFDEYASETLKNTVTQLIVSQNEGLNIVLTGKNKEFPAGKWIEVESDKMVGQNYYTLLIVGSAQNGSPNAFRAAYPVYNVGGNPVMVTDCSFEVTKETVSKVYGTLLVQFDSALYIRQQTSTGQTFIPLDGCGLGSTHVTTGGTMGGYESIYSYLTMSNTISYMGADTAHGRALTTLKFDVQLAGEGASIQFSSSEICGSNNSVRENDPLSLKLTKVKQKDGTYTWDFAVKESWDATGK